MLAIHPVFAAVSLIIINGNRCCRWKQQLLDKLQGKGDNKKRPNESKRLGLITPD